MLTFVLAAASAGFCQASPDTTQQPGQPRGEHRGGRGHFGNPEFETRMLTRRLSLSADQAAAVEPILAQQEEAPKALRPAPGTQPDFKAITLCFSPWRCRPEVPKPVSLKGDLRTILQDGFDGETTCSTTEPWQWCCPRTTLRRR